MASPITEEFVLHIVDDESDSNSDSESESESESDDDHHHPVVNNITIDVSEDDQEEEEENYELEVEEEDDEGEEEEEESENGGDEEVVQIPPDSGNAIAPRVSENEERENDDSAMLPKNPMPNGGGVEEGKGSQKDWNREDVEGVFCPICLEPWTASGDHQPSCLSCGHLFGMSCIKKWLGQRRNTGKCPQCNKKCTLKDVRRIYGTRVVVVDEESQKRIRFLEAKCDSLEKKDEEWRKKEIEWHMKVLVSQKREAELYQTLQKLNERADSLERSVAKLENGSWNSAATDGVRLPSARGINYGSPHCPVPSYAFELQQELQVDGARHFDVDDAGQFLIMARKPARIGDPHSLTKMSLASPHEQDNMLLQSAIRDLHLSSFDKLVLLAHTRRKLSVLSLESNNTVIDYDLPASAWSCSWDRNNSHIVYAGLQNGMLLVFDLRNTGEPLELRNGLTCNPIHTIYSLSEDSPGPTGVKKLLTASQVGVCEWSIGGECEEPSLIAETANQGVCISLANCPSSDNIVATFRPKVEIPDDHNISQVSQYSSFTLGHHVQGSQILMQRVNSGYQRIGSTIASVPDVRLPKSTIIEMEDGSSVFACGDEATSNLVLRELSSSTVTQRIQSHHPIRDVKYTTSAKPNLLCCLSEEKMQLFSQNRL